MLTEVKKTRQIAGEPTRRWFASQEQDLYIWHDQEGEIVAFQLCYSKYVNEHAIYWKKNSGFVHFRVDDGESNGVDSSTPILLADGYFDKRSVLASFQRISINIPQEIIQFVIGKLSEYP
jgi:hypothetical protein